MKDWLDRSMVVGNVTACSVRADCVDEKGYVRWDVVRPLAFCGAPYVNSFVAQRELVSVAMTYEGDEVGAADASLRVIFDDM